MNRREAINKLIALTAAAAIPIETIEAMLPVKEEYTQIEVECLGFEITGRAPGVVCGKMSFRVNGKIHEDLFDLPTVKYGPPHGDLEVGEPLVSTGVYEHEDGGDLKMELVDVKPVPGK